MVSRFMEADEWKRCKRAEENWELDVTLSQSFEQ